MTSLFPRPRSALAARAAVAGLLLAGCATTASSQERATAGTPATPRVALLAGADATPAAVSRATRGVRPLVVRRAGGLLEAEAQAAALAAQGYDRVIAVGPQARAAVGQARGAELGARTRWSTSR
jgi:hypothetical protein